MREVGHPLSVSYISATNPYVYQSVISSYLTLAVSF